VLGHPPSHPPVGVAFCKAHHQLQDRRLKDPVFVCLSTCTLHDGSHIGREPICEPSVWKRNGRTPWWRRPIRQASIVDERSPMMFWENQGLFPTNRVLLPSQCLAPSFDPISAALNRGFPLPLLFQRDSRLAATLALRTHNNPAPSRHNASPEKERRHPLEAGRLA
jgi:hypothetical protein